MSRAEIVDAIERLRDRDLLRLVGCVKSEIRGRIGLYRELRGWDVSRLSDKLKQAAAVVPRQAGAIEARADAIIQGEKDLAAKAEASFRPHEDILLEAHKGLEDLASQLSVLTNGGPPLSLLDTSPKEEPKTGSCPYCAGGSVAHIRQETGEMVHDIPAEGGTGATQVLCLNK